MEPVVDLRYFLCKHCGHAMYLYIFPRTEALKIACPCERNYWWSPKNVKLYEEATKAEVADDYMMPVKTFPLSDFLGLQE